MLIGDIGSVITIIVGLLLFLVIGLFVVGVRPARPSAGKTTCAPPSVPRLGSHWRNLWRTYVPETLFSQQIAFLHVGS